MILRNLFWAEVYELLLQLNVFSKLMDLLECVLDEKDRFVQLGEKRAEQG